MKHKNLIALLIFLTAVNAFPESDEESAPPSPEEIARENYKEHANETNFNAMSDSDKIQEVRAAYIWNPSGFEGKPYFRAYWNIMSVHDKNPIFEQAFQEHLNSGQVWKAQEVLAEAEAAGLHNFTSYVCGAFSHTVLDRAAKQGLGKISDFEKPLSDYQREFISAQSRKFVELVQSNPKLGKVVCPLPYAHGQKDLSFDKILKGAYRPSEDRVEAKTPGEKPSSIIPIETNKTAPVQKDNGPCGQDSIRTEVYHAMNSYSRRIHHPTLLNFPNGCQIDFDMEQGSFGKIKMIVNQKLTGFGVKKEFDDPFAKSNKGQENIRLRVLGEMTDFVLANLPKRQNPSSQHLQKPPAPAVAPAAAY